MPELLNVKSAPYNATGNGTTDDFAAVQSAVNAADGNAVYFPKGTYKLGNGTATNSLTIGGDRTVHFAPGAVLKPQTNTTITIDCPVEAERNRIFDLSGGGAIKFAQKAPRTVYPEWWGAVVGGTVNCSPAIQAAVNAITDDSTGARGGEIVFSAGEHQVLDTITLPRGYYKPKLVLRGVLLVQSASRSSHLSSLVAVEAAANSGCALPGEQTPYGL